MVFSDVDDLGIQINSFLSGTMETDSVTSGKDPYRVAKYCAGNIYALKGRQFPESIAASILELQKKNDYDYIFIGSTAIGRDVAALLSEDLGFEVASEITGFRTEGGRTITRRFFYGGKTVLEESSTAKILTVMPGISEPKSSAKEGTVTEIESPASRITLIGAEDKTSGAVDLEKAGIIVSIGRGIGKQENIEKVNPLVEAVRGELAGSRPICLDYHWLSEDRQVGLSGKKVRPRVYIALGISGQIQHIAGMRGSKTVVAINKDKAAPIFEEADYGIVGDLFQIVPKLVEAIKSGQ
ncbi:MAG: electron transfer flavoprotein subunit alpha/FixB family protein [Candidatus Thermoplasmatota archaeon]|nr:electron transfer flavoprotein subunit alpha/FixB family protein [Candidatus Thermoplasmatota archaeon]